MKKQIINLIAVLMSKLHINIRYKVRSICTLLLIMSLFGCETEFLDQPPLGELSEDQVNSVAGINALLTGTYAALNGQREADAIGGGGPWEAAPDNWIYGSVAGGDAHKGSDGGDQPAINQIARFTFDGSNGFFNSKWRAAFDGVVRANAVLRQIPQVEELSEEDALNFSAQARFLRAHYYFELKKMYNNVPWVDEGVESYYQPNTEDIWPMIESDFQYAYDNLPDRQGEVGRVNRWAAGAYLAKAYLYQAKYAEARELFTTVINEGVTSNGLRYDLVPFHNNFNAETKNNAESVFAIQMVANDGTNTITNANQGGMLNFPYESPFRCCGFYQPTIDLVNSYRTDPETGLPLLSNYNDQAVKNDMGLSSGQPFTPDTQTLDPRLDWTVGRRGIPFHDWGNHPGQRWIREQASAGPYSNKKNIYWQYHAGQYSDQSGWAPGTAINVLIIRFADILLMAAEAEVHAGSLAQAETYVNRVRLRAADPEGWVYQYVDNGSPMGGFSETPAANYRIEPYPAGAFSSAEQALAAIYFERKLELAMEGHRFFDLSRWGVLQENMRTFFSYEGQFTTDVRNATIGTRNNYFPIPQAQIDLSVSEDGATLTQNPGY